jgi:hypothetical protein
MAVNTAALTFNGTDQYAKFSVVTAGGTPPSKYTASIGNLDAFTWMAYIKVGRLSLSSQQRAYVEPQGSVGNTIGGIRFACTPYKGKLRFEFSAKDGKADTNYDYNVNWDARWHHVAFVARLTGSTPSYETYLDGSQVATGTLVLPAGTTAVSDSAPLTVSGGTSYIYLGNHSLHNSGGSESLATDRWWHGAIDDIIIFNSARNASDIIAYLGRRNSWDSASDASVAAEWEFNPALTGGTTTATTTTDSETSRTMTLYKAGVASSTLWSCNKARSNDRPYLGTATDSATAAADTTVPAAPTGLTNTTPTDTGTVTVTHNRATDNVFVQTYVLDLATLSNFSNKVSFTANNTAIDEDSPTTNSFDLTGLLPTTTYYVRIYSIDAALNASAVSSTLSFTTPTTADLTPPPAPTITGVTNLLYSSFRVNYAGNSGDTVGYSVDVALDSNFNNFLGNYQNADRGSNTFIDVGGVAPLSRYYVRVRARDAAGNDSTPSGTLTVTTPAQPDVTPPNPVLTQPPTSISSRAFTANWEDGVDNVGVIKYYVDVALNSTFTQYASTPLVPSLANYNVGNVTSFRFDNLAPSTTYYYRVRAEDSAGNQSSNSTDYMTVDTLPSSLDDGGIAEVTVFPSADAYTQSGATGTNAGTATFLQVAGNGSANTKNTYIRIDATEVAGTMQSVMLRLYVTTLGAGAITATVTATTFTENTITWANQPTMSGSTLNFTPLANNAYVEVDIGSLFVSGPAVYTIRLATIANTTYQFDSREGTNSPQVVMASDPSTATRPDSAMELVTTATVISNYITNPSFEVGTTAGWSAVGSTPATLSISTDSNSQSGPNSIIITCSGAVANQGIENVKTQVAALQNQVFAAVVYARSISGSTAWRLQVRVYNSSQTLLQTFTKNITLATDRYVRYENLVTVTSATAAFITIGIETTSAAAAVARADSFMIANSVAGAASIMYFDGDTSGAAWAGTARASRSYFNIPTFTVSSTYIGDSDADNSVRALVRPNGQPDWIYLPYPTSINRTTKVATTTFVPMYGNYNLIRNPRFQSSLYDWTVVGSATLTLEDEFTEGNEYALALNVPASANHGAISGTVREADLNDIFTASVRAYIPTGMIVALRIREYNSAGTNTATQVASATGTSGWVTLQVGLTFGQTLGAVRLEVSTNTGNTASGILYITQPMLSKVPTITTFNPYRDPTMADARWVGTANQSFTGLLIEEGKEYDFQHVYTDPDGVIGGSSLTEVSIANTLTTPVALDNATTLNDFVATSTWGTQIEVQGEYSGDDDNNMTALIEYKRYDLANWATANTIYDRQNKVFRAAISGLNEGTMYTVRTTIADPTGVFGTNPWALDLTTLATHTLADHQVSISFGGFMLMSDTVLDFGVYEHDAFGFPERRLQTQDYLREHGGIELSDFWGKKVINMKGFVSGNTRPELEANLAILKRALAPAQQELIIDTLSHDARHFLATCESLEISEVGGETIRHLLWNARFTCVDPFGYDRDITALDSLSIVNGSSVTVINSGDLSVFPLMTITTTTTRQVSLSIENETTSERIAPLVTIRKGQTLVIDNERKALYKNGVEAEYAGGFFTFAPDSNTLNFTVSADSGTPTLTVDVQWRSKYL